MAIVIWILLEVIGFLKLTSIPKIVEPFEKVLELLSVVIFDAELKAEISELLVSFDELILLELQYMVDLMTADNLFCKIEMDTFIFSE